MSFSDHPDFERPPLIEVAISAQFVEIDKLHLAYMGLFWNEIKNDFPIVETAEPLEHQIEIFGIKPPTGKHSLPANLRLLRHLPPPRLQYSSLDRQFVVQLQKDRLILNWKNEHNGVKLPKDDSPFPYPRFEALSKKFFSVIEKLDNFLGTIDVPIINIDQLEITNVNRIDGNKVSLNDVFNDVILEDRFSDDLILEGLNLKFCHMIQYENKSIGRLYSSIDKTARSPDGSTMYDLKFVARSNPIEEDVAATLELLRTKINKSFCSVTTKKMHYQWGLRDTDKGI